MRKSSKPLLLVALVVTAANGSIPLAGQDVPAASPGVRLVASAFTKAVEDTGIVGASLLVVRDGQVLTHETAGYQDLATKTPAAPTTIFHWGSTTKTLTALSIMQLRDRGKLSLDDKVTRWVPELREIHNPLGDIRRSPSGCCCPTRRPSRMVTWP